MNISPISFNYQPKRNNITFGVNDYIKKSVLYEANKTKKQIGPTAEKMAAATLGTMATIEGIDALLKENGITYCKADENSINIASGYNGGFYTIKTPFEMENQQARTFVAQTLVRKSSAFGGLKNYIDMVHDLKRQDIIQKGLRIHTYELNTNVKLDARVKAASDFSNILNKQINEDDLFFIENEAFFYDKLTRTAYGINLEAQAYTNPITTICEFKIDGKNNAIGYKNSGWDSYKWGNLDKEYTEQQEPSPTLPKIANQDNNKDMAEAYRFGNAALEDNFRVKVGMPKVIEHLTNKVKVPFISENQLHFTRFYDNNKEPQTRICYYDPTIGRSLVYSPEGKYLYQMEFNRDSKGNVYACSRF